MCPAASANVAEEILCRWFVIGDRVFGDIGWFADGVGGGGGEEVDLGAQFQFIY